ncbi:hypothetical protein [Phenylobacterium sp.]
MTQPFQQQQLASQVFLRSAPKPQHGRKTDPEVLRLTKQRSFEPRPAH